MPKAGPSVAPMLCLWTDIHMDIRLDPRAMELSLTHRYTHPDSKYSTFMSQLSISIVRGQVDEGEVAEELQELNAFDEILTDIDENGFMNATELARAMRTTTQAYEKNKGNQEFIKALEKELGIKVKLDLLGLGPLAPLLVGLQE